MLSPVFFQLVLSAQTTAAIDANSLLLSAVKVLFLLAFGLYVGFAFVVTRQIAIMRSTLITTFSPLLLVLGYAHLGIAILFFAYAILIL